MLIMPLLFRAALFAGFSTLAMPVLALLPPDERPADCTAESLSRVIHPWVPHTPTHQRAVWLDAQQLRWAAPEGTRRAALLISASAAIDVEVGKPLPTGLSDRTLNAIAQPAPSNARFSHVPGTVFALEEPLAPGRWDSQMLVVALDAQGVVLASTGVQLAGALDAAFAEKAKEVHLGAEASATGARFALWAPTAQNVSVCLYDGSSARAELLSPDLGSGVWSLNVDGVHAAQQYTYLIDVVVPGLGVVRNRVTDPYSLGLGADSQRSVVLDLNSPATQPEGWADDQRPNTVKAPTDQVIYELHVRDFSRDDMGVQPAHRGKYLAFTTRGSPGMAHLNDLAEAGVTDIHLLPTYDLATVPERNCVEPAIPRDAKPDSKDAQAAIAPFRDTDCFNWGYDPWHFTVPEGSYATDAEDATLRVREFRAMVQGLHHAGLRVGLDVVYNHTMASGQDRQSVLDRIVPGYYHRLDAEGAVTESTCCPNTATEATMMAKLMIDSAVVWARDYRVDSFRFDLMGHQPKAAMLALQSAVDAAAGRRIDLIGEGWNFGEVVNGARFEQASQLSLNGSDIGTFSDRMRDAARGGRAGDRGDALYAQGWLSGLHTAPNAHNAERDPAATRSELATAEDLIRIGLAGSLRDFTLQGADGRTKRLAEFAYGDQPAGYVSAPGEVVNYTENHDNLTLFDSNALRLPLATSANERARVQVLGNALVLLAQGIAYLHAGQEILRSKSLDRNSYNSGDAFNQLRWDFNNTFGLGLPPAEDNEHSWPQMAPVLARSSAIAPTEGDIRFALAATIDLLRVRASSTLFRLRTSADVQAALRFENTGPDAVPGLIVAHLNGDGIEGANFYEVLYALNTAPEARTLVLPSQRGKAFALHPVLRDEGSDPQLRQARFDSLTGTLRVPARTAVVFVLE